ncbi:MAG: oxygen-independent coproporphyrinogen III oxidase [Pseudomonadota bacterium]
MTERIRQYLTRPVPRYTSYPTAPHFSDAVTSDLYADWLLRLDPAQPISLYLHVPYCKQACWYCGCNMKLAARPEPVAQYAETLIQEIKLLSANLPSRMVLSHLHWGGGTPTSLSPDDLERTMEAVHANFDFTSDAEIAIESDPRTLSDEMIARIGIIGFNRASFGVQEFDPKVQATINRIQPPEMVERAVDGLRAVGISSINFDLIYGLPNQTRDSLIRTIELSARMAPDRIALFGYAHVPWVAKRQRMIPEEALPCASERLAQASAADIAIKELGYLPVGLDHFALPNDSLAKAAKTGHLKRNFQGYTTDDAAALLGVGATAIGRTPSGLVQSIAETGAWTRSVNAGVLPVMRGHALSNEDHLRGAIIEALMCYGTVDLNAVKKDHAAISGWADRAREHLVDMERDGLVYWQDEQLIVSDEALPLIRLIASAFDTYLKRQQVRHSVAV